MPSQEPKLHILLINDKQSDVDKIITHLNVSMRVPWDIAHCMTIKEAEARFNKSDIVILDLQLIGLESPEEVFKHVGNMTPFTPVIALTGEGQVEHDLAVYVMERGAADTLTRGRFARIVDAIEFALIRQQIGNDIRTASDKALSDSKSGRDEDSNRHRQILSMFGGDYSIGSK